LAWTAESRLARRERRRFWYNIEMRKVLKVPPSGSQTDEQEFDLEYYRMLSTATRFRMIIERSILLYQLAKRNAADSSPPALAKRL
jgi:hypothetical protein